MIFTVYVICDVNHRRISYGNPGSNLVSKDTVLCYHIPGKGKPSPIGSSATWFVGVLADYRHLSGAVMENAASAGSEQGAGALIRTAALRRFPRGGRLDRAVAADADALDVRWKQQDGPRR